MSPYQSPRVEKVKDIPGERWSKMDGFTNDYEVSSEGRIKSLKYGGQKLLAFVDSRGYPSLQLRNKTGKQKTYIVRRLVAKAFIANPMNKREVNHKNGVKNDNSVKNLEWSTPKENSQHAYDSGLHKAKRGKDCKLARPVIQMDLDGKFIRKWDCIQDAKRFTGCKCVSHVCLGLYKTGAGFKWAYA